MTAIPVLDAIRTAYQGDTVGQVHEGDRNFAVSVILDPQSRTSVSNIGTLPLRSPGGSYVQLRQLATIQGAAGRYVVLHDGARRVQAVTCDVAGGDAGAFVARAKKRLLAELALPAGSYIDFGGTATARAASQRELLVHSLLAGVAIVLLLAIALQDRRNLLLVLVNLPFALIGGVAAAFMMGGTLSLGSLIGFVTLFGITLRNSIMLISHFEHLVSVEGMHWGMECVIRGASERLAPILMTATATAVGLLPMAAGSGAPGREIEGPMAIVILGGLLTSTVLNLLALPAIALRYGRFEQQDDNDGLR